MKKVCGDKLDYIDNYLKMMFCCLSLSTVISSEEGGSEDCLILPVVLNGACFGK